MMMMILMMRTDNNQNYNDHCFKLDYCCGNDDVR